MHDFHCTFKEARQMNVQVNRLQTAECFITCLLELHLSQKEAKISREKVQIITGCHVFQKAKKFKVQLDKFTN